MNLTYIQFFDIFRKRYINKFKKDVLAKEIKNGEEENDAKKYMGNWLSLYLVMKIGSRKKLQEHQENNVDCFKYV